jgi:hypothetical protein
MVPQEYLALQTLAGRMDEAEVAFKSSKNGTLMVVLDQN